MSPAPARPASAISKDSTPSVSQSRTGSICCCCSCCSLLLVCDGGLHGTNAVAAGAIQVRAMRATHDIPTSLTDHPLSACDRLPRIRHLDRIVHCSISSHRFRSSFLNPDNWTILHFEMSHTLPSELNNGEKIEFVVLTIYSKSVNLPHNVT